MAGCTVSRSGCQINEIMAELTPPTHQPANANQTRSDSLNNGALAFVRTGFATAATRVVIVFPHVVALFH